MLVTDPVGVEHDVPEPPEGRYVQWIQAIGEPWRYEYWDIPDRSPVTWEDIQRNQCRGCGGRGYKRPTPPPESGAYTQATWYVEETCPRCGGSGTR